MNKTKVVAIRLTQEEYEALQTQAVGKVSALVYDCLGGALDAGRAKIKAERKREEARHKRALKKLQAVKDGADGVQ